MKTFYNPEDLDCLVFDLCFPCDRRGDVKNSADLFAEMLVQKKTAGYLSSSPEYVDERCSVGITCNPAIAAVHSPVFACYAVVSTISGYASAYY